MVSRDGVETSQKKRGYHGLFDAIGVRLRVSRTTAIEFVQRSALVGGWSHMREDNAEALDWSPPLGLREAARFKVEASRYRELRLRHSQVLQVPCTDTECSVNTGTWKAAVGLGGCCSAPFQVGFDHFGIPLFTCRHVNLCRCIHALGN